MVKKPDCDSELGYARLMLAILLDDQAVTERGIQFYRKRIEELQKEVEKKEKDANKTKETL